MYVRVCMYIYAYNIMCVYVCACVSMYVYVCVYVYACICEYVRVCVCLCIYVYVCVHVYIYHWRRKRGGGGGGARGACAPTFLIGGAMVCLCPPLLTPHFYFPLELYVCITLTNNYLAFFIHQLIILWTISIN